jgi:basic amino acid/polyamine antiporter, APA family
VLYILVAIVATGLAPQKTLADSEAPLTEAMQAGGFGWSANLLSIGALIAITSVVLTILYGQTRITFAMCRDGLLPRSLGTLNRRKTPARITLLFGLLVAALSAVVPLSEIAKLVNIGTLFAFLIVNIGIIVLRRTQPDLERGFRVPFVPVLPLIGAALCIYLMTRLELVTWERFIAWLLAGLVIYFLYSRRHSLLRRGDEAEDAPTTQGLL